MSHDSNPTMSWRGHSSRCDFTRLRRYLEVSRRQADTSNRSDQQQGADIAAGGGDGGATLGTGLPVKSETYLVSVSHAISISTCDVNVKSIM